MLLASDVHPLDAALAATLCRLAGNSDPLVRNAIVALSAASREGSVASHLADLVATLGQDPVPALEAADLLGGPDDDDRPLTRVGDRLYLRRWYETERRVAASLRALAGPADAVPAVAVGDQADQAAAIVRSLGQRLAVITGGPGTGKTWTVVRLLASILHARPSARVRLLAPTGKAAARLQEAVREALDGLPADVAARIPQVASTLHAALGLRRADGGRPIGDDVVVVDEFSMAGLTLVDALLQRCSPHTRLVLVGDADQLPPVDAGDVLDAVVRASEVEGGPLAGCASRLARSRRTTVPALARLADAIRRGDPEETLAALREGGPGVVFADPVPAHGLGTELRALVRHRFGALPAPTPEAAFAVLHQLRVLAAHRQGPFGVARLNGLIERELATMGLRPHGRHYAGRPVLVTENHYPLRLFNGDVGVLLRGPEGLRAWFPGAPEPRALAPSRLPAHETVFAMTVHKTQGSEALDIALVLPEADSPLLTRELLYTAVTRARERVLVLGSEAAVRAAVARPRRRTSGLYDALIATVR